MLEPDDERVMYAGIGNVLEAKHARDRVARVAAALRRLMAREVVDADVVDAASGFNYGRQLSPFYVPGLTARPVHAVARGGRFDAVARLAEAWRGVRAELDARLADPDALARGGARRVWASSVNHDPELSEKYGYGWTTLSLMEETSWVEPNASLFPATRAALEASGLAAHAIEAFFARQAPRTGCRLHSDNRNWVLAAHIGVRMAPGEHCHIDVGSARHVWSEGGALVMDGSFMHQTFNDSDEPRYVLIVRFWHWELTTDERAALQDAVDMMFTYRTHGKLYL